MLSVSAWSEPLTSKRRGPAAGRNWVLPLPVLLGSACPALPPAPGLGTLGSFLPYIGSVWGAVAAAAKSLQSCPTLCDPMDCSPPGSPVPGILQARTMEWVAIAFSSAWKWKVKVKSLSCVQLLVTPWTAAHQAPPSMGFSRQEYWSGVPLPSPVTSRPSSNATSFWMFC